MTSHAPARSIALLDAATPLGDAVMSEAVLSHAQVTALSATPKRIPHFSPSVSIYAVDPARQAPEELAELLRGVDLVVLTLGGSAQAKDAFISDVYSHDVEATEHLVRAMRLANLRRLAVTVPIDAYGLGLNGMVESSGPARSRSVKEQLSKVAHRWPLPGLGREGDDKRRRSLISARRALELVRLSGTDYTVFAHPPVIVAPGGGDLLRIPVAFAPKASRCVSATSTARLLLTVAMAKESIGEEYVLSEA